MPQAITFIIATIVATLSYGIADQGNCGTSGISNDNYKGRFFQDSTIMNISSAISVQLPSVYACREVCSQQEWCFGVSFATSDSLCRQFNTSEIIHHIFKQLCSTVILLIEQHCRKEDIVNGVWSAWSVSECSTTCGVGTRSKTRNCTFQMPMCRSDSCQGKKEQTEPCNDGHCPELEAPDNALLALAEGADTRLECTTVCKPGTCIPSYSWDTGEATEKKWMNGITRGQDGESHVCTVTHPDDQSVTATVTFTLSVQYLIVPPGGTRLVAEGSDVDLVCTTGCHPSPCTPQYFWSNDAATATQTLSAVTRDADLDTLVCSVLYPDAPSLTESVTFWLSVQYLTAPNSTTVTVVAGNDVDLVCTSACNPDNCTPIYSWSDGHTADRKTLSSVAAAQDGEESICTVRHPVATSVTSEVTFTLSVSAPTWFEWGGWDACSATCGDGDRQRTRECNTGDASDCPFGEPTQTDTCNLVSCPYFLTQNKEDRDGALLLCGGNFGIYDASAPDATKPADASEDEYWIALPEAMRGVHCTESDKYPVADFQSGGVVVLICRGPGGSRLAICQGN